MNAWINEWIKTWCPSSGIDWMYLTSSISKASCSTLLSNNLEKKNLTTRPQLLSFYTTELPKKQVTLQNGKVLPIIIPLCNAKNRNPQNFLDSKPLARHQSVLQQNLRKCKSSWGKNWKVFSLVILFFSQTLNFSRISKRKCLMAHLFF